MSTWKVIWRGKIWDRKTRRKNGFFADRRARDIKEFNQKVC
jgi:hypothetical protein